MDNKILTVAIDAVRGRSMGNYTAADASDALRNAFIAIAKDIKATEVTSVAFVRKHSLQSPSSVQNAIRNLLKLQMITYQQRGKTKIYSISDRFLQMWISRKY